MNARNKIALFLAVLYVTGVAGLAFNLHYCGGKLDQIALFTAKPACKMCQKTAVSKEKNNCCKDSKIDLKFEDSHQAVAKTELSKVQDFQLFADFPLSFSADLFTRKIAFCKDNKAPPELNSPSLHVLHCTFRI